MSLPARTSVLIIGGGPAGAYSGAALAHEGFDVTILEASKFPRYHIGESLLPSVHNFFSFIGAEERLRNYGFCPKPGAAVKFSQHKKEGYADFIKYDPSNHAYNVVRSEFDEFLFRYAGECGAKVFEETKATDISLPKSHFDEQQFTPGSVRFTQPGDKTGEIQFDYLVDASGRAGILSTKYLKNRQMNKSLRNVAMWGYWTGHHKYAEGTRRENAPWFESLKDGTGWVWFIPLHTGKVSVGVVTEAGVHAKRKSDASKNLGGNYSVKDHYLEQLKLTPGVMELLSGATLDEPSDTPTVRLASDFSYSAETHAGDHYRIVGDASSFIDPLFSSGVHLALLGGLTAAISIAASIRKDCSEADTIEFHNKKVTNSYNRFLSVVTSAYAQLKRQGQDVLAAPEEENFDRAMDIFMPVIKGMADTDFNRENVKDLRQTMEFCHGINTTNAPNLYQASVRPEKTNAPNLYQASVRPEKTNVPNLYQASVRPAKANAPNLYQACVDKENAPNLYQACLDKENAPNLYQACLDKENAPNLYQASVRPEKANAPNLYQACIDKENAPNLYQACIDKDNAPNLYQASVRPEKANAPNLYQACVDKDNAPNLYQASVRPEKANAPNLYQACVDKDNAPNLYQASVRPETTNSPNLYQACVSKENAPNLYQACIDKDNAPNLYQASIIPNKSNAPNLYQACIEKENAPNLYQACIGAKDNAPNLYQACIDKYNTPNLCQATVTPDRNNVPNLYQAASDAEKLRSLYQAIGDDETARAFLETLPQADKDALHSFFNSHTAGDIAKSNVSTDLSQAFAQAQAETTGADAEVLSGSDSGFRTFYQAFARTTKPDLLRNLYNAVSSSVKSEYINNLYQFAMQSFSSAPTADNTSTTSAKAEPVQHANMHHAIEKPENHDALFDGIPLFGPQDLLNDHVNGLIPRLEQGRLGLVSA